LRLVLAVAINGYKEFVTLVHCVIECRNEGSAVAAIRFVANDANVVAPGEKFGSAIGRAIVDDQDIVRVARDFVEHRPDVRPLVVHRQGGEKARLGSHGAHVRRSFQLGGF
jgi:hypothetical protein